MVLYTQTSLANEIRDRSAEILTGKKATEYPITMRVSTAGKWAGGGGGGEGGQK